MAINPITARISTRVKFLCTLPVSLVALSAAINNPQLNNFIDGITGFTGYQK
jgi:hypothetical protein